MESKNNQRKNLLINPDYQYRFLIFMVGLGVFVATIFYGSTYYYLSVFEKLATEAGLPPGQGFLQLIAKQQTVAKAIFAVLSVLIVVFMGIAGLIFSHRTAGPLYRLQQQMDSIAQGGKLETVVFRPKDYFQELANSFNAMIIRVSGKTK